VRSVSSSVMSLGESHTGGKQSKAEYLRCEHDAEARVAKLSSITTCESRKHHHREVCPSASSSYLGSWQHLMRLLQRFLLSLTSLSFLLNTVFWQPSTVSAQQNIPGQWRFNPQETPLLKPSPYPRCPRVAASKTHQLEFNVTNPDAHPNNFILEAGAEVKPRTTFRGEIRVLRGTVFQTSDIDVRVITRSNDRSDLQNVIIQQARAGLSVGYHYTKSKDICTEVDIEVFLRPYPSRVVDHFKILSRVLDIWIGPSLKWEFKNLATYAVLADSKFNYRHGPDTHIVHNLTIGSDHGSIGGKFFAEHTLDLHTDGGNINGLLVPKLEGPPLDPKNISISTKSGYIWIETDFSEEGWHPKPYTHRTRIQSESGSISVGIPHGSITELFSKTGHISAWIQPYGKDKPGARSEIYTLTESANMDFHLDSVIESSAGRHNPLKNTISKHGVESGNLSIKYPYDWWGDIVAQAWDGEVNFDASRLGEVEREDGYVYARRGEHGHSRLNAKVSDGDLYVRIGL
jgi:hypothetical protein